MSDNDAKKIVIGEASKLAASLQNGNAGNPEVQGRAIGLLVQMVTPLYAADFVTQQECMKSHELLLKNIRQENNADRKTESKRVCLKAGAFGFEGNLTPAIALALTSIMAIGGLIYILWKMGSHI